MSAPKVVAQSVGFLTLKIEELAQERSLPPRWKADRWLKLYEFVEAGEHISGNLYKSAVEIIVHIYKT